MADNKGTTDEDIGRPGPWREGRYQRRGQKADQSVKTPPGPRDPAPPSKPVTRKDYEFPGQEDHKDADPPGGDAG
jgi:hypothetical protein